jgi:hypothetical protein
VEVIGEGGRQVVVLAPSAGASQDVLHGAGFEDADTVAKFLKSEAIQHRAAGQFVGMDEAGLLNGHDTVALFDVVERLNARVILMGDHYLRLAEDFTISRAPLLVESKVFSVRGNGFELPGMTRTIQWELPARTYRVASQSSVVEPPVTSRRSRFGHSTPISTSR